MPEGRQMQVWTLQSQQTGPVPMGLLEADRTDMLDAPAAPAQGQLYEITLEPFGGSPTGRPTGPILAKALPGYNEVMKLRASRDVNAARGRRPTRKKGAVWHTHGVTQITGADHA
nr:anti-sigma factor [Falsirhodobacter deserti]